MPPLSSQLFMLALLLCIQVINGARPVLAQMSAFNIEEVFDPITGEAAIEPINPIGGYRYVGGESNGDQGTNTNEKKEDHRRYPMIDDAAHALAENVTTFFQQLILLLEAAGVFGMFLLMSVLASVYTARVLTFLGASINMIAGVLFFVVLIFVGLGLWISLEILGIDPGEIFIGLGLLSYAAVGIVGKAGTEIFQGFLLKIDSAYNIGQEISILSNRYRGIVHSKLLTEIVFDLRSPLLPNGGYATKEEEQAAEQSALRAARSSMTSGEVVLVAELVEVKHLRVSYSQFFAEERIFHKYHKTYVPKVVESAPRGRWGVDLGPSTARKESDESGKRA
jgi:hypothetical protein